MAKKDRRQSILEAVEAAKNGEFGATAIKVELEAQFQRNGEFRYDSDCHNWIMERLEGLGLAEMGEYIQLSHGVETEWNPVSPLTYAEFYRDGSVDSEFTFTLMLDDPENIFLLPRIMKIFTDLGDANGEGIDVRGAGMHTAWINDPYGDYPSDPPNGQYERFSNFARSMNLLMPTLYFLAASSDQSRGLHYRRPGVGDGTHRAAIDYRNGALEFRLFDTCYDTPETILDNVCVMSKCLKYWTKKFTPSGLQKIAERIYFGVDSGNELKRFYITHTHLDLLNKGLDKLKPDHLTVGELKAQRKFDLTKRKIKNVVKDFAKQAEQEYAEYLERFEESIRFYRGMGMITPEQEERQRSRQRGIADYINGRVRSYQRDTQGQYELQA